MTTSLPYPVAGPRHAPLGPDVTAAAEALLGQPHLWPTAGPAARLVALPQPREGLLSTPSDVGEHLAQLEAARQAQLDTLPPIPRDVVAAAHRGTVIRLLEQVRAARRRLRDGGYGICTGCGTRIHPERLELRPWLLSCTECASPERP